MNSRWNSQSLLAHWLWCLTAVGSSLLPQVILAEDAISLPEVESPQTVIDRGLKLERDRRWGDALQVYEQAVKDHPRETSLEERLHFVRSHYDVVRRYTDESYLAAVQAMNERDALRVYAEVVDKVQTHYVNEPNWSQLIRRGTQHFEVALTESSFLQRHLPQLSTDTVEGFRREFMQTANTLAPRDANQARECVAWAGQAARQRLGLSPAAVVMEFTCGAAASLDEYSSFLTATQLDEVFSQIEGNFVGLGVELKPVEQALQVIHVIPEGPAALGSIQAGDHIVEVAGQSLSTLKPDSAADMLRGEEGSTIELKIRKLNGTIQAISLTRRRVDVPCVEGTKIIDTDQGIGYFKLTSFQKSTNRDVDSALWKLHRDGMKSLIIDLRGNPGGLLNAAVELADKFIYEGAIVTTRGRNPREDYAYTAHTVGTWRMPLVVLIDGDSASASEIFAGAIRDQSRGLIVGQRSYGKGSVQGIFPLSSSKAGIRLTTAKFFSPSGQAISRQGVTPNVVVRAANRPVLEEERSGLLGTDEDYTLKAGLQVARDQLTQRASQ